jgi:hypothetical protein
MLAAADVKTVNEMLTWPPNSEGGLRWLHYMYGSYCVSFVSYKAVSSFNMQVVVSYLSVLGLTELVLW